MGLNTIIFLAGLKAINPDLYEAAALDGAGQLRSFTNVTLPGLRPVMLFTITTTVLASANMFGQSYLLTKGGPATPRAQRLCMSPTRVSRKTKWHPQRR